jgi:hypothetical protein
MCVYMNMCVCVYICSTHLMLLYTHRAAHIQHILVWTCTGIGSSTSVDFYFSRIRGIKMDTNNSEIKQGAVVPADLLQQNPYMEVIPT